MSAEAIMVTFLIMVVLMGTMIIVFMYFPSLFLMMLLFLGSLIVGIQAFFIADFPLTPYFQLIFILFQLGLFIKRYWEFM